MQKQAIKYKGRILASDKFEANDLVSIDQFAVSTPSHLLTGCGEEGENNQYHGGTVFKGNLACAEMKHIHSNVFCSVLIYMRGLYQEAPISDFLGVGPPDQKYVCSV